MRLKCAPEGEDWTLRHWSNSGLEEKNQNIFPKQGNICTLLPMKNESEPKSLESVILRVKTSLPTYANP